MENQNLAQDETPPFRENWKEPFSHLSVTIQSTEWQVHFSDHSVTIQCHSVTIPSPFSNIHFPFFPYITDLIKHYFFIYLMLDLISGKIPTKGRNFVEKWSEIFLPNCTTLLSSPFKKKRYKISFVVNCRLSFF